MQIRQLKNMNEGKIEFDKVKNRFGTLVEFIKDVRFRKNLGTFQEIKKSEIKKLTEKLKFRKRADSIDSDLDKVDLNYDFKTGKKIKDDVISDEEEYEKKKKVKKLVRRLTNNRIIFDDDSNQITIDKKIRKL